MDIDRRDLLKGAAVLGGAAALSGLAGCVPEEPEEENKTGSEGKESEVGTGADIVVEEPKWDEEYDIVIVGGGGAGFISVIAAAEADGDVSIVVYESMSAPGGSTIMSGGNIGAMGTDNLKAYAEETGNDIYKDDTFEMYWEDKLAAGCWYGHPEIAHLFCYNSLDNFNWLESLGIKWSGSRYYENPVEMPSDFTNAPVMQSSQYLMTYDEEGKSSMINRKFRYNVGSTYKDSGGGRGNFMCLQDTLDTHSNIELVCDAPVKTIVRENQIEGDVTGIILSNGKAIRAKRAVILASGGFHGNGEMIHLHDPRIAVTTRTSGGIGCLGEPLIAAQLIGAQTVNMHCIQIDFGASAREPSMSGNNNSNPFSGPASFIDVGKNGKRFWTEKPGDEQFMDAELMTLHKNGFTTWFRVGDSGSVASSRTPENLESFKNNYGAICDTIEELATFIGCDAATLRETITNYNKFVDNEKDTECGKSAVLLTHKIDTPPYYAFEAGYYCRTTPGGLRIDTNAQVVDLFGKPIPRLYAAGEVTGNVHGRFRNNGGDSWCDITCFGRIAGANAVALSPAE